MVAFKTTAVILATAFAAQAHLGCHDAHGENAHLTRRQLHQEAIKTSRERMARAESEALGAGMRLERRQAQSSVVQNWEQEEKITDATQACTYYYNADVTNLIKQRYPEIWQTANISNANTPQEDKDIYSTLSKSWPSEINNIKPRGDRYGNWQGVQYDDASDPDCWWTVGPTLGQKCDTPKIKSLKPDITSCPEPNVWGHTIDDGPNCTHNSYYDFLQKHNVKSTLFYIGSNVLDWPYQAQRGIADGHELCAHTWSHPYMTSMTNEEAFAELYYSQKAIEDVLGVTVQCWRPPYGDVDDRIRAIAASLGLRTIIWEQDTYDYDITSIGAAAVQRQYDETLAAVQNGTYAHGNSPIILSHELTQDTMDMMMKNLPAIISNFTGGVMGVGFCLNNSRPYVEKEFVYPNYAQYASGTRSIQVPTKQLTVGGDVALAYQSSSVYVSSAGPSVAKSTPSVTASPSVASTTLANAGQIKQSSSGGSGSSSDASSILASSSAAIYGLLTFGTLIVAAAMSV